MCIGRVWSLGERFGLGERKKPELEVKEYRVLKLDTWH